MSRELYDLCREYKYLHKKLRILKETDEQIYDKDLKRIVQKTENELKRIEYNMSNYFLNQSINPVEITMTSHMDYPDIVELEIKGVLGSSFLNWLHTNPCRIRC